MGEKIFIIGQCTLHWGRMEFGNIGNFYIIKPFFEELRRVFPEAEIVTTMQFSEGFCKKFSIETVPMELYYDFDSENNLSTAIYEYEQIRNKKEISTPYIEQVRSADLVIDFSGDIWGDNANLLGTDRFASGCYKDLTAQLLCPTVMIAGSPGPFYDTQNKELAKKTYAGFSFVSNREPLSTRLLRQDGFDMKNTYDYPCPSFLFKKAKDEEIQETLQKYGIREEERIKVGFMLCGWNFERGPFSAWPREDKEYSNFVKVIKHLVENGHTHVYLLSHSNGFDACHRTPFVLKHGRDFPIMKQLYDIVTDAGGVNNNITLLDGVYSPEQTKALISHFDILISGRMHGAVAGISQGIPTVIVDYGHEPKAHKLRGFAEVIGRRYLIVDPNNENELLQKVNYLLAERKGIGHDFCERMRDVKSEAKKQFDQLSNYIH